MTTAVVGLTDASKVKILKMGDEPNGSMGNRVALAMTYGRMPLGAATVVLICVGQWTAAAVLTMVFATVDLFDGIVARRFGGGETASRRMADACIDKVTVHLCALVTCIALPQMAACWLILLARDLAQMSISSYALWKNRVVIGGAGWHRVYTMAVGVWGCSILLTHSVVPGIAVVTILLGAITIIDYAWQARQWVAPVEQSTQGQPA